MQLDYSNTGAERRAMCTSKVRDYYGIRLVRVKKQPCFLSTRRELYPFTLEKDSIPAYLSARAGAQWPRPEWLDEIEGEFIDTRSGKRFPFKNDPIHRRFILDSIIWGENHKRQAEDAPAIPSVETQQPGEKEDENV